MNFRSLFRRLVGPRPVDASARLRGTFRFRVYSEWDARGVLLGEFPVRNAPTTEGLNYVANTSFVAEAQLTAWYIGLIDNTSFTTLAAADTAASHAGWIENTGYSNGTRPQWSPPAATNKILVNTAVTFNINATVNIRGAFLASASGKGATTGKLYATGVNSGGTGFINGQSVSVIYQVDFAPVG